MPAAVMPRIAAWSVGLRVDHIGAKNEKGAGLDVPAAADVVLWVVAVVVLSAGEAMLVDAREGKGGRWWWTRRWSTVGKGGGPEGVVRGVYGTAIGFWYAVGTTGERSATGN